MAHSFIKVDEPVIYVISFVSFLCCDFHLLALWWIRLRRLISFLMEKTEGETGLVLMGRAMLSNSLIQYSVDGLGSLPVVCPDYGGGSEDNGNLLQRSHACSAALSTPNPSRPPLAHASSRDSWTLVGKSESVSFVVTAPIFWVLVCTRFCLCPPSLFPQSCGSSVIRFHWPP